MNLNNYYSKNIGENPILARKFSYFLIQKLQIEIKASGSRSNL